MGRSTGLCDFIKEPICQMKEIKNLNSVVTNAYGIVLALEEMAGHYSCLRGTYYLVEEVGTFTVTLSVRWSVGFVLCSWYQESGKHKGG